MTCVGGTIDDPGYVAVTDLVLRDKRFMKNTSSSLSSLLENVVECRAKKAILECIHI